MTPIDRAAEVITRTMFGLITPSMSRNIADDLHAAGLLATPAHDAAVAAKALREAADDAHHIDPEWESALWIAHHRKERGGVYVPVPDWLRERADRIEASHE